MKKVADSEIYFAMYDQLFHLYCIFKGKGRNDENATLISKVGEDFLTAAHKAARLNVEIGVLTLDELEDSFPSQCA